MIKISAVIITYNEERNIERCLKSLHGIVDEILIVDSFSNDRTVELAKLENARVVEHPFEGYIEQKNYATRLAENNFILSLDADEALDERMKQAIKAVKSNWQYDAYSFNRLTNYCGRWIYHCGWYPDKKLRLFDRDKCHWTGVNPHDKLTFISSGTANHLPGNILHYSYYTIAEHQKQTQRFTTIAAKSLHKQGRKATFIKRFIAPSFKLFKDFILFRGFMDGKLGWTICWISAKSTFLKYQKLQQMNEGTWHE